jgi:hypothetical protein
LQQWQQQELEKVSFCKMKNEEEQLQYADILIDVSMNRNSAQCHVIQDKDDNISTLGLPL